MFQYTVPNSWHRNTETLYHSVQAECPPVPTKCCHGQLQANPSKTEGLRCSSGRRQHQFQLRRYESVPLTCCRLHRSATLLCTSTRTPAWGCMWSPLWERVVQRYDNCAMCDGVCQIKSCWRSSELSSSARSTTMMVSARRHLWLERQQVSWTDFSRSSTPDLCSLRGVLNTSRCSSATSTGSEF